MDLYLLEYPEHDYTITFFYVHKKKLLDSRNVSISDFPWIYMFWDVLNKIWQFLENVCLYYIVDTVSKELMGGNWWNLVFSCTFMEFRVD